MPFLRLRANTPLLVALLLLLPYVGRAQALQSCVYAAMPFFDQDADGMRQATEPRLTNVAVSLQGNENRYARTSGSDGAILAVAPGAYTLMAQLVEPGGTVALASSSIPVVVTDDCAHSGPDVPMTVPPTPHDARFFPEPGFRVDNDLIWAYVQEHGGVDVFGYPISRAFPFLGHWTQIFQRQIVQIGGQGDDRVGIIHPLDPATVAASGLQPGDLFKQVLIYGRSGLDAPPPDDVADALRRSPYLGLYDPGSVDAVSSLQPGSDNVRHVEGTNLAFAFILGVPLPPTRAFPADVLRGFLVALHDHPTGAEPLPYLAPALRLRVAAGQSLTSVVGFSTDYRSFCLAAFNAAAGSRLLLVTLTYAHDHRQVDALLTIVPDTGAAQVLDFQPHSDTIGPLATWAKQAGCTTLTGVTGGPAAMPATGGGGTKGGDDP